MILYLGPAGTHSQEAARRWGGAQGEYLPCRTLSDVFYQLKERAAGAVAIVPIENSIEGPVTQTLDLLAGHADSLRVYAAYGLPVQNCLLTVPTATLSQITTVYSHPQALAQCAHWLDANMPHANRLPVASTSEAAQRVTGDTKAAAISSRLAATLYNLHLAAANIQDIRNNVTRFVVVADKETPPPMTEPQGASHTLLYLVAADRPGALLQLLTPFHVAGMNLSFIQSRPLREQAWQYGFFVEAEGDITSMEFSVVLPQLRAVAREVLVLGVYRSCRIVDNAMLTGAAII